MSEIQPTVDLSVNPPTDNEINAEHSPSQDQQETLNFRVYKPLNTSVSPPPPPPDDFFTPTAADLKLAQSQLAARTQALTNAPLQLRATREAAENAKKERWPNTTIRIRFADRTQLEKVFPSTSKIKSVYAFVRNSLREDVKPIKFILYQPPKRDLKVSDPKVRDLSLVDLQLAPSSVLLLRFEDEKLNTPNVPAPLADSVLSLLEDLPTPPSAPEFTPPTEAEPPKSNNPLSSLTSGEKKIPKWLKLGKK